jgi:hypothetical protein
MNKETMCNQKDIDGVSIAMFTRMQQIIFTHE